MITQQDTICAIVTPQGIGGIGVIRISGKDAIAIVSRLFHAKSGKLLADVKTHTLHYGYIIDLQSNENPPPLNPLPTTHCIWPSAAMDTPEGKQQLNPPPLMGGGEGGGEKGEGDKRGFSGETPMPLGGTKDDENVIPAQAGIQNDGNSLDSCSLLKSCRDKFRSNDNGLEGLSGEKIDEVLVSVMRSPHSFTCEDVVEVSCHGGPFITNKILETFLKAGARLAAPGEFTKRAFLNGRIDLAQAEAVIDVINAKTEEGLRCALWQLEGKLSREINMLHEELSSAIANLEAYIDFPEDDIDIPINDITGRVQSVIKRIDGLIDGYYRWGPFREGVLTAIVGRTNVGKSSLLNTLIGEERAIVTPHPGTTRDIVDGMASIHGIPLRLLDTAGLRMAKDLAEEEGIKRMYRSVDLAELVLLVIDGSEKLTPEDREVLSYTENKKRIIVVNKIDKGIMIGETLTSIGHTKEHKTLPPLYPLPLWEGKQQLNPLPFKGRDRVGMELFSDERLNVHSNPIVYTSATTGEGIEELKQTIRQVIVGSETKMEGEAIVTNLRHKVALEGARKELYSFLDSVKQKLPLEIQALHLRGAMDHIGEITGTVTTEDILDRIFSEFCIGK